MKCAYCKTELQEDEPHVKVQHYERGSYVLTNYFCNIEHQIFRTMKGRYGMSEEKMHEIMGR